MKVTEYKLASLTSREFEKAVGMLYSQMGYETLLTQPKCDRGKDIVAYKNDELVFVEAKKYNGNPVSKSDVKNLIVSAHEVHDDIEEIDDYRVPDEIVMATTSDSVVGPAKKLLERTMIDHTIMKSDTLVYFMNKYNVQTDSLSS